jgi:hypothetical protein
MKFLLAEVDSWAGRDELLKHIKREVKRDPMWIVPNFLPSNQSIFVLFVGNEIASLAHMSVLSVGVEFSFCFTPVGKRRRGFNRTLRKKIIAFYRGRECTTFISTPFAESHSVSLLNSSGFRKGYGDRLFLTG